MIVSKEQDLQNQVLTEKILKQHQEIKNLKRSLSAQVAIAESKTAEVHRLKGETKEQKSAKAQKDESDLKKSEAQFKKKDKFT